MVLGIYANEHHSETIKDIANHFNLTYSKTVLIIKKGNDSKMCDYIICRGKPIDVYKGNNLIYSFESITECRQFMLQKYGIPFNAKEMRKNLRGIKPEYYGFIFKFKQIN